MENDELIPVEVSYAKPEIQVILAIKVRMGATIDEAVRQSGIVERFPEIDLGLNKVGVFGKLCKPDTVLKEGDRVEIYRALIADPKEARRRKAARQSGDEGRGR